MEASPARNIALEEPFCGKRMGKEVKRSLRFENGNGMVVSDFCEQCWYKMPRWDIKLSYRVMCVHLNGYFSTWFELMPRRMSNNPKVSASEVVEMCLIC